MSRTCWKDGKADGSPAASFNPTSKIITCHVCCSLLLLLQCKRPPQHAKLLTVSAVSRQVAWKTVPKEPLPTTRSVA